MRAVLWLEILCRFREPDVFEEHIASNLQMGKGSQGRIIEKW
jgi:hypothetical protein